MDWSVLIIVVCVCLCLCLEQELLQHQLHEPGSVYPRAVLPRIFVRALTLTDRQQRRRVLTEFRLLSRRRKLANTNAEDVALEIAGESQGEEKGIALLSTSTEVKLELCV